MKLKSKDIIKIKKIKTSSDKKCFLKYLNLYIDDDNINYHNSTPHYDTSFYKHFFNKRLSKYNNFYCNKILYNNKFIGIFVFEYKQSFFYKGDEIYLPVIYIDERFRNKGIAYKIINNFINDNRNTRNISFFAHKENKAIKLYNQLGFVEDDYKAFEYKKEE